MENNELNCLYVKMGHPLNTLTQKNSEDDVAFLTVPFEILEELKRSIEKTIKEKRGIHIRYTVDFKLRHNFNAL